jgi:hypothetical protein
MDRPDVPQDWIKEIETPFFKLGFSRDGKVIVIPREGDCHWTLHPGAGSGYADIHKKIERPGVRAEYETLYRISHQEFAEKLDRVWQGLAPELIKLYRPISFGWIHHRGHSILAGCYPNVAQLRKAGAGNGTRLRITAEVVTRVVHAPEYLQDIWELEDTTFALFGCRRGRWRQIGILLKARHGAEPHSLLWVRLKDLHGFIRAAQAVFAREFGEILRQEMPRNAPELQSSKDG